MVSLLKNNLSDENAMNLPLENGHAKQVKYKRRSVSAVRDFPPGCGPNAPKVNIDTQERSQGEADLVVAKVAKVDRAEVVDGGTRVLASVRDFPPGCGAGPPRISDNPQGTTEAGIETGPVNTEVVEGSVANLEITETVDTITGVLTTVPDFPPGCGPGVPIITETEAETGPVDTGAVEGSAANLETSDMADGVMVVSTTGLQHLEIPLPEIAPELLKDTNKEEERMATGMDLSKGEAQASERQESEEAALMDLLNFMYSNTLSVTTAAALLDVLMAADKFEVASCMRYCSRLLRNLPMTPESALLYLELPSSVLMAEAVQPLTDAAKHFLAVCYRDVSKFTDEVMHLPLAGIEAVFSSDDLQVASEDVVYDLILKWSRTKYSDLEERREILGSRLSRLIRFPYMTCRKLKKVLTCTDFDHELASKVVVEALFYKAEAPHRQRILAAEESANINHHFVERAYKYRPIKVIEFELPRQQCVVYLDLKREECANLFPSGRVYSQVLPLGWTRILLVCTLQP